MLTLSEPGEAKHLLALAQEDVDNRYKFYQQLAAMKPAQGEEKEGAPKPATS
jgi:hypothetical protein